MSAGDLEGIGSPLPSYPTLPGSPPKSEDSERLLTDSTLHSTLHASNTPSASGSVGSNYPLTAVWGMPGVGMDPVRWGQEPLTPQQAAHTRPPVTGKEAYPTQAMQLHTQPGYPLLASPDPSHQWASSNVNSLPPNSPNVDVPTSIPIYATVRKPAHSPSKQQSSSSRQRTTSGSPGFTGPTTPAGASPSLGQPYIPTMSPGGSPNTMALRVKHLEELCGKLSREKSEIEEDFGRQRKSFMNQMAHCDGELSRYKHSMDKYSMEVQDLSRVLLRKEEELQNVTIAAGITDATIRERFDADRVVYEEEIASLRKIVSGELRSTIK